MLPGSETTLKICSSEFSGSDPRSEEGAEADALTNSEIIYESLSLVTGPDRMADHDPGEEIPPDPRYYAAPFRSERYGNAAGKRSRFFPNRFIWMPYFIFSGRLTNRALSGFPEKQKRSDPQGKRALPQPFLPMYYFASARILSNSPRNSSATSGFWITRTCSSFRLSAERVKL